MEGKELVGRAGHVYRVRTRIGGGGMGDVYEAVDARGGRVAVKVLPPGDGRDAERFLREAQRLESVDAPGVVRYVDGGVDAEHRPWLAMEFLEGEDLASRLKRGPLMLEEVIAIGVRVCEALGALDQRGIVHRDVKPSNVFLRRGDAGAATLIDLGLAWAADDDSLTSSGHIAGTRPYMAPERFVPSQTLDVRSDLWSLGVVLLECRAGQAAAFGYVRDLLDGLSGDPLESTLRRVLSRERNDRFATPRELADALEEVRVHHRGDGGALPGPRIDPAPSTFEREASLAVRGPFIGRDPELALLRGTLREAGAQGAPCTVHVSGRAGMGKTRLWREALASEPVATLELRCERGQRAVPYGALRDALARRRDPARLAALDRAPVPARDAEVQRQEMHRAACVALDAELRALSQGSPLALVVDDVQWLDAPSWRLLRWLSSAVDDLQVAVWLIGTPEAFEGSAEGASEGPHPLTLHLQALPPHDALRLAEALGCPDPSTVARRSGRPGFIEALARLRVRGVDARALPDEVSAIHRMELECLTEHERQTLRRVAVLGPAFTGAAATALGADATLLPNLIRRRLLGRCATGVEARPEYEFRDPTLQEFLTADLDGDERRDLHRRALAHLSALASSTPEVLARHCLGAGETERAGELYSRSARESADRGDKTAALASAELALGCSSDTEARWRALTAQDDALQPDGDPERRRAGLKALTLLSIEGPPERRIEAEWRRCHFDRLGSVDERERAYWQIDGALHSDVGSIPRWSSRYACDLAMAALQRGDLASARRFADRAVSAADETRDPWFIARAALTTALVRSGDGRWSDLLDLYAVARAGFREAGDVTREAIAHGNTGDVLVKLGRLVEAEQHVRHQIAIARSPGATTPLAAPLHNLGVIQRLNEALGEARATQTEALKAARRSGDARVETSVKVELARLALRQDDPGEASAALAGLSGALDHTEQHPEVLAVSLRTAVLSGSEGELRQLLDEARATLPVLEAPEAEAELSVAVWCARRSDADRAAALDALRRCVSNAAGGGVPEADLAQVVWRRFVVPGELRR